MRRRRGGNCAISAEIGGGERRRVAARVTLRFRFGEIEMFLGILSGIGRKRRKREEMVKILWSLDDIRRRRRFPDCGATVGSGRETET